MKLYKTLSHECAIEFLREKYLDNSEVEFLQNVRKLRHGVKYYGKLIKYQNALILVQREREIFEKLSQLLENKIKLIK